MTAPLLDIQQVTHRYDGPTGTAALSDLSLSLREGEFVTLVGPSGCGKSTLLRLVAGLDVPSAGHVRIDGQPVSGPHADVTLVFQDYSRSLLPWRTVVRNVELGLESAGSDPGDRRSTALRHLALVGLGDVADHYPWQLSGGMQQRVALARALACAPKLILMDEPFASLDAATREDLEDRLLAIWRELGLTILFVTHDLDEALYVSSRVVLMSQSPGTVRSVDDVPLAYPRDQLATRADATFLRMRAGLYEALKERRAHERPA